MSTFYGVIGNENAIWGSTQKELPDSGYETPTDSYVIGADIENSPISITKSEDENLMSQQFMDTPMVVDNCNMSRLMYSGDSSNIFQDCHQTFMQSLPSEGIRSASCSGYSTPNYVKSQSPARTPERVKKNRSENHQTVPTHNNTFNSPFPNVGNGQNNSEKIEWRRKDYQKLERNKRYLSLITSLLGANPLIHFRNIQSFDEKTLEMEKDKLLNHVNQLLANCPEKEELSKTISAFLKSEKNSIFTSNSEPVFILDKPVKIDVLRQLKKSNCRCDNCKNDNIENNDLFCNVYCQVKTITIEQKMKYSDLYNLLNENGFIKSIIPKYTHKSDRKEKHPFFPTQGENLHFNGFSDLSIYFV